MGSSRAMETSIENVIVQDLTLSPVLSHKKIIVTTVAYVLWCVMPQNSLNQHKAGNTAERGWGERRLDRRHALCGAQYDDPFVIAGNEEDPVGW